jgi:hypothetical protein
MRKLTLVFLLLLTACSPQPVESGSSSETREIEVYFVADTPRGLKLFSETREFTTTAGNFPTEVLSQLISGELQPLDPDYTNLWDNSNALNQVLVSGARATIDLKLGKLNVGSEGELRAIEQLVWTLTGISPFLTTVRFLVDGSSVETFAGHIDTTVNFKRSADYEVLNPIQIESINEGAELTKPVVISGKACTFEANVVWELSQNGKQIDRGFTTADAACPQRSSWKVELKDLAAGSYEFAAIEYSAEDGSLFAVDSKKFVIK